jgi:AAA+ ATPase superfamily predicted ATPase
MKVDGENKLNFEMDQIIKKDHESLLHELKEIARNIEITKRKEFENRLLKLAQELTDDDRRSAVYEVLVSLKATWNQHQPEKGLQEKFRAAFKKGDYKEAEENYKKLARQGLDYLGTFQIGEGRIIPVTTEENDTLLHYNKKELTFYSLQFEQLAKISLPESLTIIDVHVPITSQASECMETEARKVKDSNPKIWILAENSESKKAIVPVNIENIDSIGMANQDPADRAIYLDQTLKDVHRLSYFQDHLLLISKKSISYLKENGEWDEWYTTRNEITAVESTREDCWVGQANGNVAILKNLQYVGIRAFFKGFLDAIKNIRDTGRFVLIFNKNCLNIADYTGKSVSEPIETPCEIIQSTILNDEFLLMLLANGMLIAREINQGNIRWQINLGNTFKMIFPFGHYLFCGKTDGETKVFEIPSFHMMVKELESKHIYVEKQSLDADLSAPIRYISDFIGRKEIMNEIKEKASAHFLLYGEPRIGKTSLLNVLRDVLSEKAKCCIVDAGQLLKEADSYDSFELEFMERCLEQHFMKYSELPKKDDYRYQALRSMVARIKGTRKFCVFGMDNFCIPSHFSKQDSKNFKTLLRSMLIHPNIRLFITCSSRYKDDIISYFEGFKDILGQQSILLMEIPLFSEAEAKNTLRKKIPFRQAAVDQVYEYIGRFPHLIHLYDRWEPGHHTVEEQSNTIAQNFSDKIFDYFRDLSMDAHLLITTCLYENLMSEKISYSRFYEKFLFLKNVLSKDKLEEVLKEIDAYGSGISARNEAEGFEISLSDNARLFREAAKHISWIKDFKILYEFTSRSNQNNAHQVAQTFTSITESGLESNEYLEQITKKHKDKFYVGKLTEKGLQALKMPLTTFIVIPLKQWRKDLYVEALFNLNIEFQEFSRKAGESKIFYILLFELHGTLKHEVKKDLEGLERVSIIDAPMMKDIILAESPKDKATEYIFDQLSIRERSPYTTAGAVPDSLFYGRQMEIALIRGLPENIGIFGTRTIGKTSLLRRLHKAFQSHKQWKVFDMDCSRIESEKALLKDLAEKMEVPFGKISDMGKFRRYVTKEAETGGHRYLFLLDEVDRLLQYDIRHDEKIFNTFNRLCNETMKNNETAARFILFGFQQMFKQMRDPLSRLYNFMVFLPLQALDMEGAMNLVTRPIENIRVRWNNKEEDAKYLVDSCSRHPRLLQAACNALLANLDDKQERRDMIARADVDRALTSPDFREICMRLYHEKNEEKDNDKDADEQKKFGKAFFSRIFGIDTRKEFISDLHRITILAAVRLLFEEGKETFTITDIQKELKRNDIDVSPNIMRNILDQLCLSGNFRLLDESTIIAKDGTKIKKEAEQINIHDLNLSVDHPDAYVGTEASFPKFTYEFGVRIFPKLLVAHFGGLKQCEEERQKLIEKGDWQEWPRRY